jgi:hypothetical protein
VRCDGLGGHAEDPAVVPPLDAPLQGKDSESSSYLDSGRLHVTSLSTSGRPTAGFRALTEWVTRSCTADTVSSSSWRLRNSGVKRTSPRCDGSVTYTPGTAKTGMPLQAAQVGPLNKRAMAPEGNEPRVCNGSCEGAVRECSTGT